MKLLKAMIDTQFGTGEDCCFGNMVSQPFKKTFRMKDVRYVIPFMRMGLPSFIIKMKDGTIYHSTHELEIEEIQEFKEK